MRKKELKIGLIMLFSLFLCLLFVSSANAVSINNETSLKDIQSYLNDGSSREIVLNDGDYDYIKELNVSSHTTIKAKNSGNAKIKASNSKNNLFNIKGINVTITGLSINGYNKAIYSKTDQVKVQHSTISNCKYGVIIEKSSNSYQKTKKLVLYKNSFKSTKNPFTILSYSSNTHKNNQNNKNNNYKNYNSYYHNSYSNYDYNNHVDYKDSYSSVDSYSTDIVSNVSTELDSSNDSNINNTNYSNKSNNNNNEDDSSNATVENNKWEFNSLTKIFSNPENYLYLAMVILLGIVLFFGTLIIFHNFFLS